MDYESMTKEALIKEVKALKRLNDHLIQEQIDESKLGFGWAGNLGHWYWDVETNAVTFNPLKIETLGYKLSEIPEPVPYDFFTSKLHQDDYERVMENMMDHLRGYSHVYEVEYRIKTKAGEYKWYYDRGSITKRDENGKPQLLAGIVFDITERKQKELKLEDEKQTLQEKAITDELTSVLNYRGIIEHLKLIESQTSEQSKIFSILMMDIDNFKNINDTYGHLVGDAILKELAEVTKHTLRESDKMGRYGGEEFLIVFENTNLIEAKSISERIRKKVSEHTFIKNIKLTISGGVYVYHGSSLYDLIHQADINLYEAKRSGKNKIV